MRLSEDATREIIVLSGGDNEEIEKLRGVLMARYPDPRMLDKVQQKKMQTEVSNCAKC